MNIIVSVGVLFQIMVEGSTSYQGLFFDYGFGIVSLFIFYYTIFEQVFLMPFIALGWLVAGVYSRSKYGIYSGSALFAGLLVLPGLAVVFILLLIFPLVFLGLTELILLLVAILVLGGTVFVYMLVFALPAIIFSPILVSNKKADVKVGTYVNFLVITGPIPNEKPRPCPFRSKDQPGCSFLGYSASDKPLICDFESTFRSCRIYGHLYDKVKGAQAELK